MRSLSGGTATTDPADWPGRGFPCGKLKNGGFSMKNRRRDDTLVTILQIIGFLAAVAGIALLVFKMLRKEYKPDDCEIDFENCCDCDRENCDDCEEGGMKFASEDDFEEN
jgi:hypothetical protein